jgi:microsomal dipeptidase-like Zn-dependent dipeptidase/gamma-glutamyl-gamma-aminobutyrate hydrolase PuuD
MNRFDLQQQTDHCYDGFPAAARPVIGITANYGEQNAKLGEGYYKQVLRAGGTPLIIPPDSKRETLFATLDRIDALLLSGGADINPLYQGEEPQPALGGINAERDLPELLITRLAYNRQMPILGICRGIQTLATALGGKVCQDISKGGKVCHDISEGGSVCDGFPVAKIKHSQDADRSEPTHTVTIAEDSTLLYNIYRDTDPTPDPSPTREGRNAASLATRAGRNAASLATGEGIDCSRLYVNSFHHQAVSDPGPHFRVAATAPDGIIEAIESTEFKPIVGVQWHPECMGDSGKPLFEWLVSEARRYREAQCLHDRILTLDTHCDTPMAFHLEPNKTVENRDPNKTVENRDPNKTVENRGNIPNMATRDSRILVDLPKMTEGRLDATIMVAYIPQKMQESAFAYANSIFDQIETIVADNASHLALARTPQDLWLNKRSGRKSIMLGIENGKALEGNLQNIQHFKDRGIVYITLCHNGDNDICDSAKGDQTHGGVSGFGQQVIEEMNRLGIMVDLSHAHERSFYDALDLSKTPIVCSHSSCRALCDHPRNLTDDQMRALAAKGGVCQITLYPGFLKSDLSPLTSHLSPLSEATILDAMQHLDHAIQVMGIDHVGLGTDFDGDGGVPGLADASELLNFTRELLARRYCEADIQKIWGGNFLRVMQQVQGKE